MIIRYSMIEAFLQCPKKYKNVYVDGRAEKQSSSNLHFGSAMHGALNAQFSGGDPFETFTMYWDSIKDEHLEYDRWSWENLRDMALDRFLPNFLRLHAKHIKDPKLELTLAVQIPNSEHTLQGTFDLCALISDELTMLDFKTSGSRYPQNKILRNPQLYIYSWLYAQTYGVTPQNISYKVFIKGEQSIQTLKIPLTKEKLDFMMANVFAIIEDMTKRQTFYCNHNCFCPWPQECFK